VPTSWCIQQLKRKRSWRLAAKAERAKALGTYGRQFVLRRAGSAAQQICAHCGALAAKLPPQTPALRQQPDVPWALCLCNTIATGMAAPAADSENMPVPDEVLHPGQPVHLAAGLCAAACVATLPAANLRFLRVCIRVVGFLDLKPCLPTKNPRPFTQLSTRPTPAAACGWVHGPPGCSPTGRCWAGCAHCCCAVLTAGCAQAGRFHASLQVLSVRLPGGWQQA
jgi:hypothetical protein